MCFTAFESPPPDPDRDMSHTYDITYTAIYLFGATFCLISLSFSRAAMVRPPAPSIIGRHRTRFAIFPCSLWATHL